VAAGSFLFHDWFDNGGYKTGAAHETARRKLRELSLAQIRDAVWARDCTDDPSNPKVGNCRYCGHEVIRSDRKSARKPELDHVDPSQANGVKNLVLSCAVCNKKKGRKSLEESGMVLLPEPVRTPETSGKSNPKSNQDQLIIKPESSEKSEASHEALVSLRAHPRTRAIARAPAGQGRAGPGELLLEETPELELTQGAHR
jgi:5-methylcytosine-specific restriction endonuclease McrA